MKLLDLFCGAGGAADGYRRAGFTEIVGVDVKPQPRYPFTFVQGDTLEYLAVHGKEFDAIHASPPCQCYTPLRAVAKKQYPDLVAIVRNRLIATGVPWVIENVPGSPLINPICLCGTMFTGLRVYRHRIKSTGTQRGRKAHYEAGGFITITGDVGTYCGGAMDIDWMNGNELSQAIPPAYTEFVGKQLLAFLFNK